MLFEIQSTGAGYVLSGRKFMPHPSASLGLLEKDIEHWIAEHPDVLLPNEQVLVFGQSISGKSMADVLALDSFGRLIIIEVKRDLTGRETVAQLLGYAARLHGISYEELNGIAQQYSKWPGGDLYSVFSDFFDAPSIVRVQLGRNHRTIIVAPDSDADLKSIVGWLRHHGVPIEFVPYAIYAEDQSAPRFLQIEGISTTPEAVTTDEVWLGHWIFNTNETHAPGAYKRMFARNVAAIYGYPNGPKNLEGAEAGQKVFAYVNRQGIRALGIALGGEVRPGTGVFVNEQGYQLQGEYHLPVRWDAVLTEEQAISVRNAAQLGYNLPVRLVFGRLHSGQAAQRLENEVTNRVR